MLTCCSSEETRSHGSRLAARASYWSLLAQARAGQVDAQDDLRKFHSQTGGAVKLPDEARADLQRLT
jgi:hypothetical protein